MRTLFIILFLANIALGVVSLQILPPEVAMHFGGGGVPDSWGSREFSVLLSLFFNILMFPVFFFTSALVFAFPPRFVNLPNKNYWLAEENKAATREKLSLLMCEFGSAFYAFFIGVGLLSLQANLSDPVRLNETVFLAALGIFLLYTVWWCIKLYRGFRVPGEDGDNP